MNDDIQYFILFYSYQNLIFYYFFNFFFIIKVDIQYNIFFICQCPRPTFIKLTFK